MRNFFLKFSGVVVALTLLIATGCEDDDPIGTGDLPPEIRLLPGTGLTNMDAELAPGETFTVEVQVTPGDNPLNEFTFSVDGNVPSGMDLNNYFTGEYTIDGSPETANNPAALITDNVKDGATFRIEITPFGQVDGETSTYTFEVTDEANETASTSLNITVIDPTTPIDTTMMGLFYNVAGQENGSFDLDNGVNVTSVDTNPDADAAEIRDIGIDCEIDPDDAENWRQQIHSINGTELRQVDETAVGENFTFGNVDNKEAIVGAFESGIVLDDGVRTRFDCSEISVTDVSEPVVKGDMFVALRDGRYYLFIIDDVIPAADNSDRYEISVKY